MSDFKWQFSTDLTEDSTVALKSVKFGDGYQQRYASGINNLQQTWSGSITRAKEEVDEVIAFLKARSNGQSFTFTPIGGTEVRVTCTKWSRTWEGPYVCKLSLTLERVYE